MNKPSKSLIQTLASKYVPPPIKCYTDACEAPVGMWGGGAIPLYQTTQRRKDGSKEVIVKRLYSHPPELSPPKLTFQHINTMYCLREETFQLTYPEGLGGRVMQTMVPGHPRGFLYRTTSHLLNMFIEKIPLWQKKSLPIRRIIGNRPGIILDGLTGTGKSALLCQAVNYARFRDILTIYVPNARDWTHGEWSWPSVILPGFFDVPDATRNLLKYLLRAHPQLLKSWVLKSTPTDLPVDTGEISPKTLYDLCHWGGCGASPPSSVDRQSIAIKYFLDEIHNENKIPILFIVDGWNLFAHESHFRFPHPDFLKNMSKSELEKSDSDLYPMELPRIPASRLSFIRGINRIILEYMRDLNNSTKTYPASQHSNKFFITATSYDRRYFDGVSGFHDVENDKDLTKLDEYATFHVEKDTFFHPIQVKNFDSYEYRSFLRFLINSGELAGLGWGPLWHHSSNFERKLYKIDFLSERNPQRVVDHYHGEMVWRYEYERLRQKQYASQRH